MTAGDATAGRKPAPLLSVADARMRILALMRPVSAEEVPLAEAHGRVLAETVVAARAQPPFAASAMDGYALRAADCRPGAALRLIGVSAAGSGFAGRVGPGEAVRVLTGAPMPEGADAVLIQEEAERDGERLRPQAEADLGAYVRPRGLDFAEGFALDAPRRLCPAEVALLAAMNAPRPRLRRRPRATLLPTGDELVEPGETPGPDQIFASNHYGLAALLEARGARARLAPAAADRPEALAEALRAAAEGADLVVTLGGASVGDHDHVGGVVGESALEFHRVAMRPGKPLMAGRFAGAPLIGLPGNPVSAMVCGLLFVAPAVDALLGLPPAPPTPEPARLAAPLPANGVREHYMRARCEIGPEGLSVTSFEDQDSSRLAVLAAANALILRPPGAPAAAAGETVSILRLPA